MSHDMSPLNKWYPYQCCNFFFTNVTLFVFVKNYDGDVVLADIALVISL